MDHAENKKLPLTRVLPFADEALRLGCYSKTQRYNFETAWAVLTKSLPHSGLTLESNVEQLLPKVDAILKDHGRKSSIKAASLRAYKARIEKLIADFIAHNGGDYMAWKEQLDKSPSTDENKSRRRRKPAQRENNGDSGDDVDTITHRLIAGTTKEGKITLPNDLTEEEVDRIWTQLSALQTLIKAQTSALKGKPAKASDA